jgi:hypothetical protein
MTSQVIELPKSGAKLQRTDLFNKENIKKVLNDLLDKEETIEQFKANPVDFLNKIGIIISAEDLNKITREEECDEKSGERLGPSAAAAVIVVVITLACPSPAH